MWPQIKDKAASNWRESGAICDRQYAAARALPWKEIGEVATAVCVGGLGAIGALIGLALGLVLGSLAGALIGIVLGVMLRVALWLVVCALLALIPAPFAWLARRLGYA